MSRGESHALKKVIRQLNPTLPQRQQLRAAMFQLAAEAQNDDPKAVLDWLEAGMRLLEAVEENTPSKDLMEVHFSPGEKCLNRLQSLIKGTKDKMDICVYTITDNRLANCLKDAHNKGIAVRIISDAEKADDRGADLYRLRKLGLNVVLDGPEALMHHKFAIFDNKIIATGSYNWTRTAATANHENIIVSTDKQMLKSFRYEFNRMWDLYAEDRSE